ncbi:MAG: PAS domain S-box protein [Spirochaetia bacterium]
MTGEFVYILDARGIIIYVSPSIEQYGLSPNQLIGKNIIEIVRPRERRNLGMRLRERRTKRRRTRGLEIGLDPALTGGKDIEIRVEAEGLYSEGSVRSKNLLGTFGICRPKKPCHVHTERRIREKIKNRVISNLPNVFYTVAFTHNPEILFLSPKCETWTGISISEIKNDPSLWQECIADPDKKTILRKYKRAIESGDNYTFEYTIEHRIIGEIRHIRDCGQVIRQTDKSVVMYEGVISDITARKKLEEELELREESIRRLQSDLHSALRFADRSIFSTAEFLDFHITHRILPYIDQLKSQIDEPKALATIDLVESNMSDLLLPVHGEMSRLKNYNLTPMEIRVVDLIKKGKTSEQIAEILNISTRGVNFHRSNLRKKFGLTDTDTNLYAFILSL